MLEHGGRLRRAAQQYGIALSAWMDLSTAINPLGYVPPPIPAEAWQRLPESDDGLEAAAAMYYGNANLLPLSGSQAAIQAVPKLFAPQRVAVLSPTYSEHAQAWRSAGHAVVAMTATGLEHASARGEMLVLCNPNNPDAQCLSRERLLTLARDGRRVIVDEAFVDPLLASSIDAGTENTVTPHAGSAEFPNLIVLRSLGKFFGLAGARVGFVFAAPTTLTALADLIGPWAVAGPSRVVATAALRDTLWQAQARARLADDSVRLATLLAPLGAVSRQLLFAYVPCHDAAAIADAFARRGILVRCFEAPHAALRFGLPGDDAAWQRLTLAIEAVMQAARTGRSG